MKYHSPSADRTAAVTAVVALAAALATLALATLAVPAARAQVSVLTVHNDSQRTGANLKETILTPAGVSPQTFGKLFARSVDGQVYAQPLYVSDLTMPGYGTCNVVFVATMHNSVYAFDADDPNATLPLWKRSLGPSVPAADPQGGSDGNITGEIGILGTPVIDPATGTLYAVARTKENGDYLYRIHALDILTGAERAGSPAAIAPATYPGVGDDSDGTNVRFNFLREAQRPGLLLSGGHLYVAFASHEDIRPYHGWLMTFDAKTLRRTGVYCTTPDGGLGGIWQSGQGPTADEAGNVYVITGNGTFNANASGGRDLGNAFIKFAADPTGAIRVADWFAPYNTDMLTAWDYDIGCAGVMAIPGTKYVVGVGKESVLYLLDRNAMGHFRAGEDTQIPQRFQAGIGAVFGSPVFWPGPDAPLLYVWSGIDHLRAFRFRGDRFDSLPVAEGPTFADSWDPGAMLSVSANGSRRGTGIVWAALARQGDPGGTPIPGALRAYNAEDVSQEIWSSEDNTTRDGVPLFAKFCPPTVANGKVYLPTFSGQLLVYGLLARARPDALNAGGAAVKGFQADAGFIGGSAAVASATLVIDTTGVANPAPLAVYKTARQGNFSYVRGGLTPYARYTLRLHFADVTNGRLPASAVMNVSLNGVRMLADFAVPRASRNKARALVRSFVFNAPADGTVSLVFRAGHLGAASASSLAAALGPGAQGGQGASAPSSRAILPSLGGCLVSGIEIVPGAGS